MLGVYRKILQRYNVKLVLLDKNITSEGQQKGNATRSDYLKQFLKKHDWLRSALGVSVNDTLYHELTKLGWRKIYEDDVALILEK